MNESSLPILIVDDCEPDRYLLKRELKRAGVSADVFEVADGVEAIEFLSSFDEKKASLGDRFPPRCIFVDINMPLMGGFEFLDTFAALRATRPQYQSCVVIVCSSSEHPDEQARALAKDFVADFVIKGTTRGTELKQKVVAAVRTPKNGVPE